MDVGLQKGALGALLDRSGTPFDQAKLMVDVLRRAGVTAGYQAGTIRLDSTQFREWTGITSATAACQLLASGGIPAAINDSTIADCNYGSAGIANVTLSHIWVTVVIGGTTYLFDPSYKPHAFKTGIANLNGAAGLPPGQALSSATSGMQTSSESGVSYVRNLNTDSGTTSLNATLQTYGTNLLNHIQANMPAGEVEDVVGGADIVAFETPAGGLRQTTLPYSNWIVQRTWSGDIPDKYRTTLQVHIDKNVYVYTPPSIVNTLLIDKTLFVDEIYGRKLIIQTSYPVNVTIDQDAPFAILMKVIDHSGTGPVVAEKLITRDAATFRNATIMLSANHPYAASNPGSATAGDYMDAAVTEEAFLLLPMTILHGWGDAGPGLAESWASRIETAIPSVPTEGGCEQCAPSFYASMGESRREQMAVSWLVQATRAAQLHAMIANSVYTHHHSLGVVSSDASMFAVSRTSNGTGPYFYTVQDNFDRIDVDSAFSLTSTTANADDRRAAIFAIAATSEALEGSIAAQISDLPDTTSTATRFEWGNRPPPSEDGFSNNRGARRFYRFNAANAGQAEGLAIVEGKTTTADDGHYAGNVEPEIGSGEMLVRKRWLRDAILAYANAGFDIVASEEAFLGPGQRGGAYRAVQSPLVWTHLQSKQRGGALIATRTVGGEPVEIAHIVVGDVMAKGGGGGAQTTQQADYDPSTAADLLKARFVDRSQAVGVDLRTGSVTYTAPATISIGNGEFPYQLTANLIWRGGNYKVESFGPQVHTEPQTPWTTNWNNTLTMSASGLEAMGASDVRAAAGTIAAFMAQQDIYRAAMSTQREAAAVLVGAWWLRQISGNVVTVNVGANTRQFVRNVIGQWIAPGPGPQATLAQNGDRTIVAARCNGALPSYVLTRGWSYAGTSFQVVSANGDTQNFAHWARAYRATDSPYCANMHGFRLATWTFPRGVTISFVYTNPGFGELDRLTEVNNSLGRKIRFNYNSENRLIGFDNGLSGADARAVTIDRSGPWISSVTDPTGATSRFSTSAPKQIYRITGIYDADDPSGFPSLLYVYDSLVRVWLARDAVGVQQGARGSHTFNIAPGGWRGERKDPAGGSYAVLFDEDGRPVRHTERVDANTVRTTNIAYDGRGRATRYVYPEFDREEFQYDDRNNVTQFRRCPKQGCGASDIVVNATWHATWNKPDNITDARSYRTDFTYVPSGAGAGQIATAVRPAPTGATPIGSGARPTYNFTYDPFGRVATSTDPTGVVISNAYQTTGNRNLISTTLDPTGVNAVTTFTHNAIGDVLTTTDPRSNVTEAEYNLNRQPTVTKHHGGGIAAPVIAAERTNYNLLGQVTSQEGGTAFSGTAVTTWVAREARTYTPTGQVETVTNGEGNTTTNIYDPVDRLLEVRDPINRVTRFEFDLAGQMLREIRGFGSSEQHDYARYTYAANGQRSSVRDANNNRSDYVYDGFDRLIELHFPMPALGANQASTTDYERYGYDENGNRTSLRLRSGEQIGYHYDNLNRECFKDLPSLVSNPLSCGSAVVGAAASDVFSEYDLAGRRRSARYASASGDGIVYGYDTAGRLTSETSYGRALGFLYEDKINRTRLTFPDGNYIQYTFDALNRMDQVRENGVATGAQLLADYAYNPLSRRTGITRASAAGAATTFSYDNASRLTQLFQNLSGGTTNDQTLDFGYSPASQITSRTASNDLYGWTTAAFDFDYSRNGLNQYTSVSGTTYSHDARGNLTGDGARVFCYDLENRLTGVASAGGNACASPTFALSYDPLGRLRQTTQGSTLTQFLYDGDRLVAEYNGAATAPLRRYGHGAGIDEPLAVYDGAALNDTTRRWLHADHQGSIIAASDGAGALAGSRYAYGPYGEPDQANGWTGQRFRYTGQIALPEAQLYYYKARVYDPRLGRFLQTDPVGYEDDYNLYAYVRNDPLNLTDPTGEKIFEEGKLKLTIGLGASVTGAAPTSGSPGANAAGEVVAEIGVAPNNPDTLVPPQLQALAPALPPALQGLVRVASMISVDRVGVQTSDGVTGDTGSIGAVADLDIAEVSGSLGTIADREGLATSAEYDVGPGGGEIFSPGDKLAGSGARFSVTGPGLGAAVSRSETRTVISIEPDRRERNRR